MTHVDHQLERPTPLPAVLSLAGLASVGTGVIWNGLPFIAKHDYGYTQRQSLWLYAVVGIFYVIGALSTGRALRTLRTRLRPRSLIAWLLVAQTLVCFIPLVMTRDRDPRGISIWLVAGATSVIASMFWPIVETYITSGRRSDEMRRAIGWFNIVWTGSVTIALILMAPLVAAGHARLSIVAFGGFTALALLSLLRFRPAPLHLPPGATRPPVPGNYPALLRSARVLLPLSYILVSALSPLMPYLLGRLEVREVLETPATAVWMVARCAVMVVMWRTRFWHGRGMTLVAGALSMTIAFGLIVAATNVAVILAGLALFGAAAAILYFSSLYYAMRVGHSEVDASGTHEALIGTGYAVGPGLVLAGMTVPAVLGAGVSEEQGIIAIVWIVLAIGLVYAWRVGRTPARG